MSLTQKNLVGSEARDCKTLVSVNSESLEFADKLSKELRNNHFPVMRGPSARSIERKAANMALAFEHARDSADMIVCVNCRRPNERDVGLEKSEKGGFKPVVSVLSMHLADAKQQCHDIALVKKFPGNVEESIANVLEGLAESGVKKVPIQVLIEKIKERNKGYSERSHIVRKGLLNMSEGKTLFVEIDVFPANKEETERAVKDCVAITKRLRETKDVPEDNRFFYGLHKLK
jgi:hypothetical protein